MIANTIQTVFREARFCLVALVLGFFFLLRMDKVPVIPKHLIDGFSTLFRENVSIYSYFDKLDQFPTIGIDANIDVDAASLRCL